MRPRLNFPKYKNIKQGFKFYTFLMDYKNSMEATVRYHLNSQQLNAEKPPAPAEGV